MWAALFTLVAVASPFEDIQHRFVVDLPRGWSFAPMPGDTHGATFRRETDGVFANAAIRVMPFARPIGLESFASRVAAASEGEPGYRLMAKEAVDIAGHKGQRRRFVSLVNGDTHMPKLVEQRLVVVGSTGFVVHAETLADAFGVFETDIMQLEDSFRPGPAAADGSGRAAGPKPLKSYALRGLWHSSKGSHSLTLSAGQAAILDGVHGTWSLEEGMLIVTCGTHKEIFEASRKGKQLILSGGRFGPGTSFVRRTKDAKTGRSTAP